MLQTKVRIIENKKINERYVYLIIEAPEIAKEALPGQFVQIKVSQNYEPFLRRPLSVHRVNGAQIKFIYEIVGKGTQLLSRRKPREYLDVIGPLGNGFDLSRQTAKPSNRQTILVAGGMGVAPLVFLAEKLVHSSKSKVHSKPLVLLGAKTKGHIVCEKEFKSIGCDVKIATDDDSSGFKGKVTELLKYLLSTIEYRLSAIYACGPRPMLKGISAISQRYNIPAQISLEEHMACGIGACLGCAVKTRQGFERVCKEGPVFDGQDIIW